MMGGRAKMFFAQRKRRNINHDAPTRAQEVIMDFLFWIVALLTFSPVLIVVGMMLYEVLKRSAP